MRTAFSPTQLLKLEHAFESNQYVVGAERKTLAQQLSLTETQVIINLLIDFVRVSFYRRGHYRAVKFKHFAPVIKASLTQKMWLREKESLAWEQLILHNVKRTRKMS